MLKKTIFTIFISLFFLPSVVLADVPSLQIDIPNLSFSAPTTCPNDSDKICYPWIGEYIVAIYNYAIGIVGIVAAAVLMWGGVTWLTAGGSPDKVNNAKSWITASLTGLLIAMASYTILYTINPKLTLFTPLGITPVSTLEEGNNKQSNISACLDCVKTSLPTRGTSPENLINKDLESNLRSAFSKYNNLIITELYPPTAEHKNTCHQNGTCVDVALADRSTDPDDVTQAAYALYTSTFGNNKVVYETNEDCAPYEEAFSERGINVDCKNYEHITGSHFSVYK